MGNRPISITKLAAVILWKAQDVLYFPVNVHWISLYSKARVNADVSQNSPLLHVPSS